MAYQGPFPQQPMCRMPCKHWPYVKAFRYLIERERYDEARVIVERNSDPHSATPHDWTHELSAEEWAAIEQPASVF